MRLADLCKDMRFQNVLNATFQNFYPQLRTQHQTFIAHTILLYYSTWCIVVEHFNNFRS